MGAQVSKPSISDIEDNIYLKDASLSIWQRQKSTNKDGEQTSQATHNDDLRTADMTREEEVDRERDRLTQDYLDKFQERTGPDSAAEKSKEPGWKPDCPWCGRANEFDQEGCDPVHPRMCVGGDDPNKEIDYGSRNSQYNWSEAREKLI